MGGAKGGKRRSRPSRIDSRKEALEQERSLGCQETQAGRGWELLAERIL